MGIWPAGSYRGLTCQTSPSERSPERYSFSNSDKSVSMPSAPSMCSTTASDPARLTLSIFIHGSRYANPSVGTCLQAFQSS
jgi:hypothetical protein